MSDTGMIGFRTTFQGMFRAEENSTPRVDTVEIPMIQRDYAQGREDPRATAIRSTFLDALHAALTKGSPVGLDFIYGEVQDGRFEPLDGQQRLTTLFLLHWYLAFRRGDLSASQAWTSFSYATRPSARLFCQRIVEFPPPADLDLTPSMWIKDQSWYLHLWRFDPTICAMLVTIDAIAQRFASEDHDKVWGRLTDEGNPAVWFQMLPIGQMGAAEDLYIKMNSRGKPLTEFEAFKAHLGKLVAETGAAVDFGHKIDGVWTDLFWPYRGDNDIVDDEFMRYFDFLIEVCEWREDRVRGDENLTPEKRISALLGDANPRRFEHLDFICGAFDVWVSEQSIPHVFASLFKTSSHGPGVRLFGASSPDLFLACCERYGEARGATRLFSLTDTLLLLAVLVHRMEETDDAVNRLRTLRNVNEASQFEMRVQNMPKLIDEVAQFIKTGDLSSLKTFNQNQVVDEALKRDLRSQDVSLSSALEQLEDHTILRGTLALFPLDADIDNRAAVFEKAFDPKHWAQLTGALLATGDYQRDYPGSDRHRFGSPTTESVWRLLLVDRGDREALQRTGRVVMRLLEQVAESPGETGAAVDAIIDDFVKDRSSRSHFDWRYYLVRYPTMREGNSGIYYGAHGKIGYELTMLRKTQQNSWYRDAYLYAIWCAAGCSTEVEDPWFYGYSTSPRWMKLKKSNTGLRSVPSGIAIQEPATAKHAAALGAVCATAGATRGPDGWLLAVPQHEREGELIDAQDRVEIGARMLDALIAAGL